MPEGCTAERAGVWVAPARYVEGAGVLAALRAEVEGLKRERDEARAARRELSEQLNDTLAAQVERLKLIEALCAPRAPEPCPVWSPRAEGAGWVQRYRLAANFGAGDQWELTEAGVGVLSC